MPTYYTQDVPSVPVRAEPLGIERVQIGSPIYPKEAGAIRDLARGRWSPGRKRRATTVLNRHGYSGAGAGGASATPADMMRARLAGQGVIGARGRRRDEGPSVVTQVTRSRRGFRGKRVKVIEQPGGPRGGAGMVCKPGYRPMWNPAFKSWFCGNTRPLR